MASHCSIKYLRQEEAVNVDKDLFNECAFSVDQLMELAGLSVAIAVSKSYRNSASLNERILICCGPGNNGGDGLVAARHLQLFGFKPDIYYPKPGRSELFQRLVKQCQQFDIKFLDSLDECDSYPLIIDAVFGFSYKPPLRPEFRHLLQKLANVSDTSKLICVDIPSGWDVENGPPVDSDTPVLKPDCLVSLTAPKLCAAHFTGRYHWLGGRFVPPTIMKKYDLKLPSYSDSEQCLLISSLNN